MSRRQRLRSTLRGAAGMASLRRPTDGRSRRGLYPDDEHRARHRAGAMRPHDGAAAATDPRDLPIRARRLRPEQETKAQSPRHRAQPRRPDDPRAASASCRGRRRARSSRRANRQARRHHFPECPFPMLPSRTRVRNGRSAPYAELRGAQRSGATTGERTLARSTGARACAASPWSHEAFPGQPPAATCARRRPPPPQATSGHSCVHCDTCMRPGADGSDTLDIRCDPGKRRPHDR